MESQFHFLAGPEALYSSLSLLSQWEEEKQSSHGMGTSQGTIESLTIEYQKMSDFEKKIVS